MRQKMRCCCALGLLLLGCDDSLLPVELISDARVLGARVEVVDAPGRAAPAPGESATVEFLVATPDSPQELGFALAVCPSGVGGVGRAACATEPFASVRNQATLAPPSLSFETPADLDPEGRLLVLGVICPDGQPSAEATSCEGPNPGTRVALELELLRDDDVNTNPELEDDAIRLDDAVWAGVAAAAGDCAGLGHVEVAAGSQHRIHVRLDETDRDPLLLATPGEPDREALQLSHFTTAGDLSRAFSSIAPDDAELGRSIDWTAPMTSQWVRLWFVVRDLRGGSDFTERAVCVVP